MMSVELEAIKVELDEIKRDGESEIGIRLLIQRKPRSSWTDVLETQSINNKQLLSLNYKSSFHKPQITQHNTVGAIILTQKARSPWDLVAKACSELL
ncbi:hypothetical protein L1887_22871 [Cichorium endivia]|nr:hypothetical protein L1887_22871 [Cichorium endivia]